ncbi:extracellular solute-binding protein family 5 [Coriobacterium glomerans PW2]|uniref:Extracellular solute-binding protein family 5 n=2 Tax=Coriobacterium TaxID=33870 RepID=F2NA94_CORGP|nr:extracellular solute-binding protein family 5 [Coriobacterium glomerans PW2]
MFSRRRFIEMLGISAAGFGLIGVAGCGGDAGGDGRGGSSGAAGSGGALADSLVYGQGAEPRSLDPAYYDDGESAKIACNIYDGLYCYGAKDAKVAPALAEALPEISDDGLVYTIKLKKGIKFHDGTDFNAEAVKKSIERQLAPNADSDMPYATFVYGEESIGTGVEKVEAPDDATVKITLRAPSTPFLKNLAMSIAAPIVSPAAVEKATGGNIGEAPCGTGPYKFVKWTKSDSITLEANPDYWGDAPKTKNVVFKFILENNTRVTSLLNGECDVIDGIDLSSTTTITDGGYDLFAEDGMTLNYMAFNTESGKCVDRDVRRAIAQAINVSEIVQAVYGKYATVANSVMPTWMASYDKDIKQTAFDADAAKKTLKDKGITELNCITYSNPRPYNAKGGQVLAETIQGYLEKVGVKLNITTYDWTTYKNKVATDPFDVCFYGWQGDNGDPDNFMNLLADSNWSMNVSRFNDADYRALIAKGLETPDGEERDEIYRRCEQMVADEQIWLLISHAQNLCGVSPKVKDFYYHPTGAVFLKDVSKQA